MVSVNTLVAAARFHALAATATKAGGFWVSAGGGTANVVAGEIARATCASFEDAHRALTVMGGNEWYAKMAAAQPFSDPQYARWDVRTIVRAACRPVE